MTVTGCMSLRAATRARWRQIAVVTGAMYLYLLGSVSCICQPCFRGHWGL